MTSYRPFRKKRSLTVPVLLIVLALFLSFTALPRLEQARTVLLAAVYPFQYSVNAVWGYAVGLPGSLLTLHRQSAEIARLKGELDRREAQLSLLDELRTENDELRAALSFGRSKSYGRRLLAARVVARSGSPWPGVIEVSQGEHAGVRPNMTVIARKGLVGRVLEVTPVSSKVLLITDPLSAVSAVLGRSRNIGVIEGYSTDSLNLRFLGTGSEVAVGDQVATAAISSVVLPGIPIGTVVSARKNDADLFFEVRVKPAVDFGALETVYIVQ